MKYAIIESGGKQLQISVGHPIWIEKIPGEINEKVKIEKVLALNDGKTFFFQEKDIKNASVIASIQKQGKGPKLTIFRTKAKSNWSRKQGHRQPYTRLMIEEILMGNKTIDKYQKKEEKTETKILTKIVNKENKEIKENKTTTKALPENKKND